jgi:hypothetical protein
MESFMSFPAARLLAPFLLTAALVPAPASAAFETWRFPGAQLPFRLTDVRFSRDDRREAVTEAVRDMAKRQLLDSGLFPARATGGVTVVLLNVESSAVAAPDGTGVGRAAILYRVDDAQGRALFNDRIESEVRVELRESLPMQQSTVRAARYRAFTRNLDDFAHRFWLASARGAATTAPAIGRVVLDQPLETPERTDDYAARVRSDLAILAVPSDAAATGGELRITALSFRETSAPGADAASAEAELTLSATAADGTPVWTGIVRGQGSVDRHQALLSGLMPTDAALAAATQTGLKRIAPELAAALEDHARIKSLASRRLPFGLAGIDAAPGLADTAEVTRLRVWNSTGHPFAAVWRDDGPPLRIRVEALTARLKKTAPKSGIAEISATYSVIGDDGKILLTTRQETKAPFSAAPPGAADPGNRAMRVALSESWNGLLERIEPLAVPLTAKDDSDASR